jgi:hypothetical protein
MIHEPAGTARALTAGGAVAETRICAQCGTPFPPRREHARFCSPGCRAAWNSEHLGEEKAGTSALQWGITAMTDTTLRLSQLVAWDRPRAFALIGEAVWWVSMVDATLVRHHLNAYDLVMTGYPPAERELVEGTLAGLRFVRNRIGDDADLADFIEPGEPGPGSEPRPGPVTGWVWKLAPEPELASLSPRGRSWETARYQAYQAHLAGRGIGETFGRTTVFLELAAARATLGEAAAPAVP